MDVLGRIERMGRRAALPAFALAAIVLATGVLVALAPQLGLVPFAPARMIFIGATIAMWSPIFVLIGVRALTASPYDAEEAFPSMSEEAFRATVQQGPRPIGVCTNCRISIPGEYSTGSCPRCGSALDWYDIGDDRDAELVLISMS